MSDSVQPHRRQPTRLLCPWDSSGKNTGVGCHCLLQCMKVKSESEVAQSCPTLSDPTDCSLPGSSVHGIFQARVLEWGATAFSRASILLFSTVSPVGSDRWPDGWAAFLLYWNGRQHITVDSTSLLSVRFSCFWFFNNTVKVQCLPLSHAQDKGFPGWTSGMELPGMMSMLIWHIKLQADSYFPLSPLEILFHSLGLGCWG